MSGEGTPAPWRRRLLPGLGLALAALLHGCAAHVPPSAQAPPPPPRPRPGYERLSDSLGAVDAHGLIGKRIALDPGHGGVFRGAIGVHGLTEAEVNLDVALRLRDLLVQAGAQVFLTRDRDQDFLTPQDSTLRSDLAARVARAALFDPDLFLSIHHNADAGGRHDVNETQTYYKLGDEGPSLDVAQDVHRALVRNISIPTHKVAAGNYFVLRNTSAPAILTETSYITDPDVEAKLAVPEKRELEAQALFVGLARYFARPVPRIEELEAFDPARIDAARVDSARASNASAFAGLVAIRARVAGEFDRAELRVDGAPVAPVRTEDRLLWSPAAPLSAGSHRAELRVRLDGVGSARERAIEFTVRRPPVALALSSFPVRAPAHGGVVGLRVEVRDTFGLPVLDTLAVRVTATMPAVPAPRRSGHAAPRRAPPARASAGLDTLIATRDGVGWAYLRIPAAAAAPRVVATLARAGRAPEAARVGGAAHARPHGRGSEPTRITASLKVETGGDLWTGFVRLAPGDSALVDAPGTQEPRPTTRWIDRDGFATLERDARGAPLLPMLPGYRLLPRDSGDAPGPGVSLVAIAGGALRDRRIVIDPMGGGDQPGGVGPGGTRAASLNLEVARALAALLEASGAQVKLTRTGDLPLSDVERVQIAEAFQGERFLRIAHAPEPPRIGYSIGSGPGRRWAERLARVAPLAGLAPPAPKEDADIALQQISCPALRVSFDRIDRADSENRLLAPGAVRAEAWALWLGLAAEWGDDAEWTRDSVQVEDGAGRPVPGNPVRLGGVFLAETDPAGVARFPRTEPQPLEVEATIDGVQRRAVLLQFQHGIVMTGP